jgi:hypothetical protein
MWVLGVGVVVVKRRRRGRGEWFDVTFEYGRRGGMTEDGLDDGYY